MKPLPRLLLFLVLMNGFMLASLPGVKPLLFFPITSFKPLISLELTPEVSLDFRQYEFFAALALFAAALFLTKVFRPGKLLMISPPFLGFIVYFCTGVTYALKTQETLMMTVVLLVIPLFLFQAVPWWVGFFLGKKLNRRKSELY